MVPFICIVAVAYTFSIGVLCYVNWVQGRELAEVRAQNERLIACIGTEYGFTTTKPYSPAALSNAIPPIGPTPPPMFSYKDPR